MRIQYNGHCSMTFLKLKQTQNKSKILFPEKFLNTCRRVTPSSVDNKSTNRSEEQENAGKNTQKQPTAYREILRTSPKTVQSIKGSRCSISSGFLAVSYSARVIQRAIEKGRQVLVIRLVESMMRLRNLKRFLEVFL